MDEWLPVEPVQPPSPARRRFLVAVTLVVVAAFVVVAGLEGSGFIVQPGPEPAVDVTAPPSAPARLAFVDLDGALGVMDPAGSIVHLPAQGATFQFPAWSPDATRIAAIRTGDAGTSLDVFPFPGPPTGGAGEQAGTPTTIFASADQPVFYLYWAPDSRSVGFLTTEPDGLALRRAPIDAADAATIVRTGAPMYWQWVDPTRLLVHSGGTDAFAGVVGLDGTPADSGAIEPGAYRAPALSNDGRYVAFGGAVAGGGMTVAVAARDGSARHDVPVLGPAALEFDPGGDTVAFTAAATAGASAQLPIGPLRVIDATTGSVRTLLDGSVVTFFWSPDGRTIAAISIPAPGDTKVASTGRATVTLARAGAAGTLAVAGVTLRLTFVDVASGSVRSVRDLQFSDLFVNQVLPYFDQFALSHRFWSPDSRSITLPIVGDSGASKITSVFADGSDSTELVDGTFASWSP